MFSSRLNMRFATLLAAASLVLATFAGGIAFPTLAEGQVAAAPSAPTAAAHRLHVVRMTMKNYRFVYAPETVIVNVGDTVEWVNDDIYQHNVVSADHKSFNSGIIDPKRSWRYKAVKKGTYPYICTLHPNMKGTLIVR